MSQSPARANGVKQSFAASACLVVNIYSAYIHTYIPCHFAPFFLAESLLRMASGAVTQQKGRCSRARPGLVCLKMVSASMVSRHDGRKAGCAVALMRCRIAPEDRAPPPAGHRDVRGRAASGSRRRLRAQREAVSSRLGPGANLLLAWLTRVR